MPAQAELNKEYLLTVEAEDPDRLIEHEKSILRESYDRGEFLRDFHSKTHAGVKAELVIEPNLGSKFRDGVSSESRRWPAWVRFLNDFVRHVLRVSK